ncbi:MAG: serine/threonine protein kinase, partial [Gemmatimonadetes bacterium]|nr:serine/threonine protein kinase [Gemmatimonadota bacterium]
SLVEQRGPLPSARVVHILRQACESLAEAHAVGLVHRDIKPANIYLCHHGLEYDFVKVLDFGLVRSENPGAGQNQKLTSKGVFAGTPMYCAPEMITAGKDADGRSDLYSLGCVAYWLLTGQTLFEGDSPFAIISAHLHDEPTPPSVLSELEIPSDLEAIVLWCLEKDPDKRPRDAAELARRLAKCASASEWTQKRARQWWKVNHPTGGDGI